MLEWKEIKGYDKNIDYNYQKDNMGIELPELEERILIDFQNVSNPNREIFVGYVHVWKIGWPESITVNCAYDHCDVFKVQDGIKWARFNKPERNS